MRLIMNGINGHYLRNIIENSTERTEEVLAAVAYATDETLLFDWCWKHKIPLKFYGRLDDTVPVNPEILSSFLDRKSPNFTCKLVQYHHAKVIWWRGMGVYIGSANLTGSAWYKNVEAGCFFPEEEISDSTAGDILELFNMLEANGTPLTEELLKEMQRRSQDLNKIPDSKNFWNSPSFKKWDGLVQTAPKKASDRKRALFLEEWHATLQELRNIGKRVSSPGNRPSWINSTASAGAQADQFLHAHYYQRTFEGRKANYKRFFEDNKARKEEALIETIEWWRKLPIAPGGEDEVINERSLFLQEALTEHNLTKMDETSLRDICIRIHAIKDYARRVPNKDVNLPDDGTQYTIQQKVDALAKRIWNDKLPNGTRVKELLRYILYSGSSEQLPERLWQGITEPMLKIDGLGISSLGEIIGWALPDRFPPRNGRTSKALKSLGYDVTIHVE